MFYDLAIVDCAFISSTLLLTLQGARHVMLISEKAKCVLCARFKWFKHCFGGLARMGLGWRERVFQQQQVYSFCALVLTSSHVNPRALFYVAFTFCMRG